MASPWYELEAALKSMLANAHAMLSRMLKARLRAMGGCTFVRLLSSSQDPVKSDGL